MDALCAYCWGNRAHKAKSLCKVYTYEDCWESPSGRNLNNWRIVLSFSFGFWHMTFPTARVPSRNYLETSPCTLDSWCCCLTESDALPISWDILNGNCFRTWPCSSSGTYPISYPLGRWGTLLLRSVSSSQMRSQALSRFGFIFSSAKIHSAATYGNLPANSQKLVSVFSLVVLCACPKQDLRANCQHKRPARWWDCLH